MKDETDNIEAIEKLFNTYEQIKIKDLNGSQVDIFVKYFKLATNTNTTNLLKKIKPMLTSLSPDLLEKIFYAAIKTLSFTNGEFILKYYSIDDNLKECLLNKAISQGDLWVAAVIIPFPQYN